MNVEVNASDTLVRHFRQILLWPLQLMPIQENAQIQKHWEVLESAGRRTPGASSLPSSPEISPSFRDATTMSS